MPGMPIRKGGDMNTVTINTAMLIAIVCIIIGFVTGGFIGYFNKDRRKKTSDDALSEKPGIPPVPLLVDPAKYTELLHLWREKESAGLFVETSGHLLASSEPLNEKQKTRFIDLIKELADWLNIPPEAISEKSTNPKLMAVETKAFPADAPNPVQPVQAESLPIHPNRDAGDPVKTAPIPPPPPVLATVEIPIQSQTPPPIPAYYPPLKPTTKPVVEPAKKKIDSMVEQIDNILQEVIQNSEKPDRKIRLVEEPKEGVIVWIANEHFIGIDAVPDPIVKDLIRMAVKEWDRRTESHLYTKSQT